VMAMSPSGETSSVFLFLSSKTEKLPPCSRFWVRLSFSCAKSASVRVLHSQH